MRRVSLDLKRATVGDVGGHSKSKDRSGPSLAMQGGFRILSRIAPSVAARAAEHVFRTPRRFERPAREWAWLANAQSFSFRLGRKSISAWHWGPDRPPVLLVHGWEGRGSQLGAFVQPLVAAGHAVVAFDACAHGSSPGRRSSLPEFVDAIFAASRRIGAIDAIVAHSMGAAATALAMSEGLSVSRAAFVAAPANVSAIVKEFAAAIGISSYVRKKVEASIEATFQVRMEALNMSSFASKMNSSLLVIHDSDDKEVPIGDGRVLAERWPHSTFLETKGLGHRRILRDPKVVRAVTEYLRRD